MASSLMNRSKKGRTGRMTYNKRKKRNIDIKRIKTKLVDGWAAPAGCARPVTPAQPSSPIVDLSTLDFSQ